MTPLAAGIIIAVIALIGSAAVAAIISAHWQRNQYEAETLHAAFKSVMEARASLIGDSTVIVTRLQLALDVGHIWESQKQEMIKALADAQQHAIDLVARVNVCAGIMDDEEVAAVLKDLAEATRELTRALGIIQGFYPSPTLKDGITLRLRDGVDRNRAVEIIVAGIRALNDQNLRFISVARARWRSLLEFPWR